MGFGAMDEQEDREYDLGCGAIQDKLVHRNRGMQEFKYRLVLGFGAVDERRGSGT